MESPKVVTQVAPEHSVSHAAEIIMHFHHVNGPTILLKSTKIPYKANKQAYHIRFVDDDSRSIHKFDDVNSTIKTIRLPRNSFPMGHYK